MKPFRFSGYVWPYNPKDKIDQYNKNHLIYTHISYVINKLRHLSLASVTHSFYITYKNDEYEQQIN